MCVCVATMLNVQLYDELQLLPSFKSLHGLSSPCDTAETNLTSIHKDAGSIPDLAQWLGDPVLWCWSQMQLRSHVAVAVAQASSCSSHLTPRLGTSVCLGRGNQAIHQSINAIKAEQNLWRWFMGDTEPTISPDGQHADSRQRSLPPFVGTAFVSSEQQPDSITCLF